MDRRPHVELIDATFRLSRFVTVGPISFRIDEPSFVALVGANGSGKTTALRALVGLRPCSTGAVLVNGAPVLRRRLPRGVAAIIEEPRFLTWMSSRENLAVSIPDEPAVVDAALSRWGLADVAGEPTARLSQGMRQRLGLARVDCIRSDVVLLDEPTNALDVIWQDVVWEFARRRRAEGCIVVVATHALDAIIAGGADRCVVLADGRVAADFPVGPDGSTPSGEAAADVLRGAVEAAQR